MTPTLPEHVATLRAQVVAIEARQDRQEIALVAQFATINAKLDQLTDSVARARGAAALASWLTTGAAAVLGFVAAHVFNFQR